MQDILVEANDPCRVLVVHECVCHGRISVGISKTNVSVTNTSLMTE